MGVCGHFFFFKISLGDKPLTVAMRLRPIIKNSYSVGDVIPSAMDRLPALVTDQDSMIRFNGHWRFFEYCRWQDLF